MQITKAALDILVEQRKAYDEHIAALRHERANYYQERGHTNHDWLDAKLSRIEAERSGFIKAVRIMGIDIRS